MHSTHVLRRRMLPLVTASAIALALAVGLGAQTSITPPGLRDLAGIDALRSAFNADQANVRVVLLLSPT